MKLCIQFFLVLAGMHNTCIAQNTFSFKAQVYNSKSGPQKNLNILIDNQYPAVTNNDGVFVVGLPRGTNHVRVSLSKTDYTILYPYGGYIPIPRDLNELPQVIIGNSKENDYLNQYLSIYKLIKQAQKDPSAKENDVKDLQKKMSSLEGTLTKLNYTQAEIRTAKQIQDGKDDYLPEISADLLEYRAKAIDLKTAFKYVSDYAFNDLTALQMLADAITKYNYSFTKLDRQQVNYEKRIADFWQSDTLKVLYHNLISFALDTVHKERIFPMQETIGQIRNYFQSGSKKDNELKKSIQQKIGTQVQQLEVVLPRLEKDTNEVLNLLADS